MSGGLGGAQSPLRGGSRGKSEGQQTTKGKGGKRAKLICITRLHQERMVGNLMGKKKLGGGEKLGKGSHGGEEQAIPQFQRGGNERRRCKEVSNTVMALR